MNVYRIPIEKFISKGIVRSLLRPYPIRIRSICNGNTLNLINVRNFSSTIVRYNQLENSSKFHHVKPKIPLEEPKRVTEDTQRVASSVESLDHLKSSINSVLKENIYTIPNFLTASRIFLTPAIGYSIIMHQTGPAMVMFTYSCITDFLDGYIARRYKLNTILGTILDPIADKLLMGVCTIALSVGGVMPMPMMALIVGKDAMLALMGIYYRYTTLPPPKTWSRLVNLSIPTVKVEPNLLSKINTGLQMVYIGNLVFLDQLNYWIVDFGHWFGYYEYLVGFTTVLSALSYLVSSSSIKKI